MSDSRLMIELHHVTKVYNTPQKVIALSDVSLTIKKGEFVAVMGPSGSGKSTLLHILGCLDLPTTGSYYLESKEVHHLNSDQMAETRSKKVGFVFQSFYLISRLTALQNVALSLLYSGHSTRDQLQRSLEMLKVVGLSHRAQHTPAMLSGGEQQRVALARALVNRPAVILADEPTGNLDTATGQEIIALLKKFQQELGVTLILVTHDPQLARQSERIISLRDGQIDGEKVNPSF